MVWGLEEPSGFGIYFPHGDYPGWKERLEAYWRNEMSEEERKRIQAPYPNDYNYYATRKFSREIGASIHLDGPVMLTPLLPNECPWEFRAEKTVRELGSLLKLKSMLLAVDEPLKALIVGLEPGRHQFWPLRITGPNGADYPVRYYAMVVHRYLDSFRPEQSTPGCWTKSDSQTLDWYYSRGDLKASYAGLALEESAIAGAHIWYERRLRSPNLFISDTLQAEIKRAGLKVWKHYRMKSV